MIKLIGWVILGALGLSTLGLALPIAALLWISLRLLGCRIVSAAAYNDEDGPAAYRLKEKMASNEVAAKLRTEHAVQQSKAMIVELRGKLADLDKKFRDKQFDLLDETEIVGLYEPHYDFENSQQYTDKIKQIRDLQKRLIKNGQATHTETTWTVSGSAAKGRQITKDVSRMMLRAFNGECDALISTVKHNNVARFEERIKNCHAAINKLGDRWTISIQNKYLSRKIEELHLVFEYAEMRFFEKEEQKRIAAQIREEEKAFREVEKARIEAEKEARQFERALARARAELSASHGAEAAALEEQISLLQADLTEAQERGQRALSQAQLTKSGYVYVISNIGSFGQNVYKIGMTRRLQPLDRVKELGDASVPFPFDVHAMIYAGDAPRLENLLHRHFRFRRLNLANHRKEFFAATLDEIVGAVPPEFSQVEFIVEPEAREYWESLQIQEELDSGKTPEIFDRQERRIAMEQAHSSAASDPDLALAAN